MVLGTGYQLFLQASLFIQNEILCFRKITFMWLSIYWHKTSFILSSRWHAENGGLHVLLSSLGLSFSKCSHVNCQNKQHH